MKRKLLKISADSDEEQDSSPLPTTITSNKSTSVPTPSLEDRKKFELQQLQLLKKQLLTAKTSPMVSETAAKKFKPSTTPSTPSISTPLLISTASPNSSDPNFVAQKVGIFWDIQRARVTVTQEQQELVQTVKSIQNLAQEDKGNKLISFKAYGDIQEYMPNLQEQNQLQHSGVTLIDTPSNIYKEFQTKTVLTDLCLFLKDNPAPATIILITSNQAYAFALNKFKARGYRIILVGPSTETSDMMKNGVSQFVDWKQIGIIRENPQKLKGRPEREQRKAVVDNFRQALKNKCIITLNNYYSKFLEKSKLDQFLLRDVVQYVINEEVLFTKKLRILYFTTNFESLGKLRLFELNRTIFQRQESKLETIFNVKFMKRMDQLSQEEQYLLNELSREERDVVEEIYSGVRDRPIQINVHDLGKKVDFRIVKLLLLQFLHEGLRDNNNCVYELKYDAQYGSLIHRKTL